MSLRICRTDRCEHFAYRIGVVIRTALRRLNEDIPVDNLNRSETSG
jgi:hypothetical protein